MDSRRKRKPDLAKEGTANGFERLAEIIKGWSPSDVLKPYKTHYRALVVARSGWQSG